MDFSLILPLVKVIRFVFALYVLFLAVFPCSDVRSQSREDTIEAISLIQTSQENDLQEDICTPFCICACCATHIKVTASTGPNGSGVIHNTKAKIPYVENMVSFDSNNIWQPPRI